MYLNLRLVKLLRTLVTKNKHHVLKGAVKPLFFYPYIIKSDTLFTMLDGVRIVEIEGLGPTPFAGMLLADLGAEVIVIHRKNKTSFSKKNLLDRGKRSIELDLKDPEDLQTAKKIINRSDALIEGFRPGVMEKLGLGPDALMSEHPKLVYGRMTGWGQDGPKSKEAGHDLNYIGLSGALWYASHPDTPPFPPPTLVGDVGGGALYLVIGVLTALLNIHQSGKGSVIDAAIVDGSAHMMNLFMSLQNSEMFSYQRGGSLLDGTPWSRSYRTSDNLWMTVQCLEPKFYSDFIQLMELADHPKFKNQLNAADWNEMAMILEDLFSKRSQEEWMTIFEGSDACVAPVLNPIQSRDHPHMEHRQVWIENDDHIQAAPAPRFSRETDDLIKKIPERGEHQNEILDELGENKF